MENRCDPGKNRPRSAALPRLLDTKHLPAGAKCVIARASDLSLWEDPEDNCFLICCEGTPPALYKNGERSMIVVEPEITVIRVHNAVQEIFFHYHDWSDRMHAMLGSNVSLQEMLDLSSPVLENMLVLTDENHNLIAASEDGHMADAKPPSPTVMSDAARISVLDHSKIHLGDRFYYFDLLELKVGRRAPEAIFIRFYLEKTHIATLSMIPTEHPLGNQDRHPLSTLASFVLIQLLRPSEPESKRTNNLLLRLLNGARIPEKDLRSLETKLSFTPSDELRCIVLKLQKHVASKSGTYLRGRIRLEASASLAGIYEDHIIAVINVSQCDWDPDRFFHSLESCLGHTGLIAAMSDPFHQLTGLHDYYRQARGLTDITLSEFGHLLTMAECWDDFILTHCLNGLPPELIFPQGLRALVEYNETSAVDYLETLRVYLEEGTNDSRTAARLYISRNAFLYRLEKIRTLLGNDLTDPDDRFRLELSLRLLRRQKLDTF